MCDFISKGIDIKSIDKLLLNKRSLIESVFNV
ncbi:hypothetical protein OTSTA763_2801, partial [Orientia tsutsugamushi str. TA763]